MTHIRMNLILQSLFLTCQQCKSWDWRRMTLPRILKNFPPLSPHPQCQTHHEVKYTFIWYFYYMGCFRMFYFNSIRSRNDSLICAWYYKGYHVSLITVQSMQWLRFFLPLGSCISKHHNEYRTLVIMVHEKLYLVELDRHVVAFNIP